MPNKKELRTDKIENLLPLINASFIPGECFRSIEAIENHDQKEVALANYYQLTMNSEEAIAKAKPYIKHEDQYLRISACITLFFASLNMGDKKTASAALSELESVELESDLFGGTHFAETIKNMLFSKGENFVLESKALKRLPEGVRYYISYFFALHELLRGRTEEALGIAKSALLFGRSKNPIIAIYLNIILGAAYTFLKDFDKADAYYKAAWDMAYPDKFLSPFVQQSLLIFGFDRKYIKENHPNEYKLIGDYVKGYLPAWGALSENINWFSHSEVSRMELVVGVLFKHGFSVKEISSVLMISPNTVKTHLMAMRQKTGAANRNETLKIHVE